MKKVITYSQLKLYFVVKEQKDFWYATDITLDYKNFGNFGDYTAHNKSVCAQCKKEIKEYDLYLELREEVLRATFAARHLTCFNKSFKITGVHKGTLNKNTDKFFVGYTVAPDGTPNYP